MNISLKETAEIFPPWEDSLLLESRVRCLSDFDAAEKTCLPTTTLFLLSLFRTKSLFIGKKSLQYVPVFVLNIGTVLLMLAVSVFYFSSPSKLGTK